MDLHQKKDIHEILIFLFVDLSIVKQNMSLKHGLRIDFKKSKIALWISSCTRLIDFK